ncbi:MAG: hypothetical protein K2K97_01185, partial [Muribaculaceae bacterium]|nr:hypothetical protein [Muribaculaceae bacterium]
YVMEGYNWARLAQYHLAAGNIISAQEALDSAKNDMAYPGDTLRVVYIEYLLAKETDPDRSLSALRRYNNEVINTNNNIILNTPLPNVTESYQNKANDYKKSLKTQKIIFGVSSLVVLIGIIYGARVAYGKFKRKKVEIDLLNDRKDALSQQKDDLMKKNSNLSQANNDLTIENSALSKENNHLSKENSSLRDEVESVKGSNLSHVQKIQELSDAYALLSETLSGIKNVEGIQRDLKGEHTVVIKSALKQLDEYYHRIYQVPEKDIEQNSFIKDSYKHLSSERFAGIVDRLIDIYAHDFMEMIKAEFPRMRESRSRLVRYLYAGFGLETMLILLKLDSRKKLDNAKWDLKKRIIEKKEWSARHAKSVLKSLHLE